VAHAREVFVSYAHEDRKYVKALEPHLAALVRNGILAVWHDARILPGADWKQEILDRLERADVVLLLVSSDFMASDFVWSVEVERAVARHRKGEAVVVPVILRPVLWENSPIGALQALPQDARPVASWPNEDDAWLDVATGISRLLSALS
jgi:hypothetical protein